MRRIAAAKQGPQKTMHCTLLSRFHNWPICLDRRSSGNRGVEENLRDKRKLLGKDGREVRDSNAGRGILTLDGFFATAIRQANHDRNVFTSGVAQRHRLRGAQRDHGREKSGNNASFHVAKYVTAKHKERINLFAPHLLSLRFINPLRGPKKFCCASQRVCLYCCPHYRLKILQEIAFGGRNGFLWKMWISTA